ncbi:MAG: P-loop NTPase, partial [Planctomycetes bacterium]|nr:P-loop NTPase [Planctomycetota bacterium]
GIPAGSVIVTTPQDLSIADVRRCVSFCKALSLEIVGIVENMSGYVCPNCGQRVDLFKTGGGKALAEELGLALLGQIPIDPQVVISGDAGTPFAAGTPDLPAAQAFAGVTEKILALDGKVVGNTKTENRSKENHPMKIAIPLANGRLSMHFGHCEEFAIVEVDEATKKMGETELLSPPGHEPGVLPRWLHEQGATVIIAGGMGQRAQQLFEQNDITVVVGASGDQPEQLVSAYLSGLLETGENICDH